MNEVQVSYEELLAGHHEDLSSTKVSYTTGRMDTINALNAGLENLDEPMVFRVFDSDRGRYLDQLFFVTGVHVINGVDVYSVMSATKVQAGVAEFIVHEKTHNGHTAGEFLLQSFGFEVEPVSIVDQRS